MYVLIVDDKKDERTRAVQEIAKQYPDADIHVVGSFGGALRSIETRRPDILMTDLMYPYATGLLSNPAYWEQREESAGLMMVIYALVSGIKKIAVVTDTNHHDHPVAGLQHAFEARGSETGGPVPVQIGSSTLVFHGRAYGGNKNWGLAIETLFQSAVVPGEYSSEILSIVPRFGGM